MSQVYIYDEDGKLVAISDFAILAHKLVCEFDGARKYRLDGLTGDALARRLDHEKRRQDNVRRLNWEVERVVWSDHGRPRELAGRLWAAAERASRTGPLRGAWSLVPLTPAEAVQAARRRAA